MNTYKFLGSNFNHIFVQVQYPIDFLNIALDDWEKFQSVTRVVSAVVRPMEVSCKIHWKTQARSLYHRLIYTNIDIHEKLRHCNTRVQVRYKNFLFLFRQLLLNNEDRKPYWTPKLKGFFNFFIFVF